MTRRGRTFGILVALLVLALGGYAALRWRDRAAAAASAEATLEDAELVLAAPRPDRSELSGIYVRLSALDELDPRVRLLLARVDLARGRYEPAAQRLEGVARSGSASVAELRTAAAAWIEWHLHGGKDAAGREQLGRQAQVFADAAAGKSGAPEDLFVAWQTAVRLADEAKAQRWAQELQDKAPASLQARTVAAIIAVQGVSAPVAPLQALAAEWQQPPEELQLSIGVLLLGENKVEAALRVLDELLVAAPNLLEVRNWVATAHHVAAMTLELSGEERQRHERIRDAQIAWLDGNAPASDPRRPKWLQMRQAR